MQATLGRCACPTKECAEIAGCSYADQVFAMDIDHRQLCDGRVVLATFETLARLGVRHDDPRLNKLLSAAKALMSALDAWQLARLLKSVAAIGTCVDEPWLELFWETAMQKFEAFGRDGIEVVMHASAAMRCRPSMPFMNLFWESVPLDGTSGWKALLFAVLFQEVPPRSFSVRLWKLDLGGLEAIDVAHLAFGVAKASLRPPPGWADRAWSSIEARGPGALDLESCLHIAAASRALAAPVSPLLNKSMWSVLDSAIVDRSLDSIGFAALVPEVRAPAATCAPKESPWLKSVRGSTSPTLDGTYGTRVRPNAGV